MDAKTRAQMMYNLGYIKGTQMILESIAKSKKDENLKELAQRLEHSLNAIDELIDDEGNCTACNEYQLHNIASHCHNCK